MKTSEIPEFAIAKLDLAPDDVLVVRSAHHMPAEHVRRLGDAISRGLPYLNKVFVLEPGFSLEVLRATVGTRPDDAQPGECLGGLQAVAGSVPLPAG